VNRSLIKYRLIIEEFGGWPLFQQLLEVLQRVALRHGVDIASVATRMVLDRPEVAAAIVGATNTAHLPQHRTLGGLMLSSEDARDINAICAQRRGPSGEVYALERDRDGPHGRIMKYTLNRA
jgi:aryl-alcohol dehydrogenase-like predicted oxidoreductase